MRSGAQEIQERVTMRPPQWTHAQWTSTGFTIPSASNVYFDHAQHAGLFRPVVHRLDFGLSRFRNHAEAMS